MNTLDKILGWITLILAIIVSLILAQFIVGYSIYREYLHGEDLEKDSTDEEVV